MGTSHYTGSDPGGFSPGETLVRELTGEPDVTLLPFAGTDIDERKFVRKADVGEECKETRRQGLRDRLVRSDEPEADQLRAEIADREQRIDELTEFAPGSEFSARS